MHELTVFYQCIVAFCRDNCRLFRPNNLGGCLTCRAGFTGAPECCECEPGKTEVNGVCSKCHIPSNIRSFESYLIHNFHDYYDLAQYSIWTSTVHWVILFAPYAECTASLNPDGTCAEGALEPDCCECDTTGNETHAFYKTPSGECKREYTMYIAIYLDDWPRLQCGNIYLLP